MNQPFVAILMGSDSDFPIMKNTVETLKQFQISCEVRVLSAHRTPLAAKEYVENAEKRGCAVFICAAGLAAHLAGFVAAHTVKPVIGVPLDAGSMQGLDALLATVQMPGGVPVACVAIGKPGAVNAAMLSVQILAVQNESLRTQLLQYRQDNQNAIMKKNEALQAQLEQGS